MTVKLFDPATNKEVPLENLTLKSFGPKYRSTKVITKRGRWYYELTHVSGDDLYIIGFQDGEGKRMAFYPKRLYPDSSISSFIPMNIKQEEKIGLSTVSKNSTIGLGIDMFNGKFYIRSQQEIISLSYDVNSFKVPGMNTYTDEATNTYSDIVTLNFGASPFKYDLLPGFTAWGKNPIPETLCHKRRTLSLFVQFILIIII